MQRFTKILIDVALVLVIALLILVGLRLLSGEEDTWLCANGQWVKHGNPSRSAPAAGCRGQSLVLKPELPVVVSEPIADAVVLSPLVIKGQARGSWYFEASFPVKLLDDQGRVLASGVAQAESDWMTENFVPFLVTLNFYRGLAIKGELVLSKDNPSGLPENDAQVTIPVRFTAYPELETVEVFYGNNQLDPEATCEKVFPIERPQGLFKPVLSKEDQAEVALRALLSGSLTDEEKSAGYFTSINNGVKVQSLKIKDGTARVDFSKELDYQVAGSCRVTAIRAQIEQTLKQFSTVKSVVISVDGRTEDILQP